MKTQPFFSRYGGPGTQAVSEQWGIGWDTYLARCTYFQEKIFELKKNEKVIILQNLYKSHMELVLAKPALHNFWEYWLQKLSKTCFPCVTKIFSCLLQKDLFCSLFSYDFTNSAPLVVCFFVNFFKSVFTSSQRNFIVASVDVRGSGFQGDEFKHSVFRF